MNEARTGPDLWLHMNPFKKCYGAGVGIGMVPVLRGDQITQPILHLVHASSSAVSQNFQLSGAMPSLLAQQNLVCARSYTVITVFHADTSACFLYPCSYSVIETKRCGLFHRTGWQKLFWRGDTLTQKLFGRGRGGTLTQFYWDQFLFNPECTLFLPKGKREALQRWPGGWAIGGDLRATSSSETDAST